MVTVGERLMVTVRIVLRNSFCKIEGDTTICETWLLLRISLQKQFFSTPKTAPHSAHTAGQFSVCQLSAVAISLGIAKIADSLVAKLRLGIARHNFSPSAEFAPSKL